jgi:hypothetical protein
MEIRAQIDEVALLFPQAFSMRDFVFDAVMEDGVDLFNVAYDRVHTLPFETDYNVQYAFLSTTLGMRVECMALMNGFSPLHQAMFSCLRMEDGFNPAVVHMSFKCNDIDQYLGAVMALQEDDNKQVQICQSTYGVFSYFNSQGFPHGIYLKPRVNERDLRNPSLEKIKKAARIKPGEAFEVIKGGI